jgi:hypothetical protein
MFKFCYERWERVLEMVRRIRGLGMEVSVHVVPAAALLSVQVLSLLMGVRAGDGAAHLRPGHGGEKLRFDE